MRSQIERQVEIEFRRQEELHRAEIRAARDVVAAKSELKTKYNAFAVHVGEVLRGPIFLACNLTRRVWVSDLHTSGYEDKGELTLQTYEPDTFETALFEIALGLREKAICSSDRIEAIEVVSARDVGTGLILPWGWSSRWLRTSVLSLEATVTDASSFIEVDEPQINTPPEYFVDPPVQITQQQVVPVREAKVLTR